jgi:pantoate--beta-alanine ligase
MKIVKNISEARELLKDVKKSNKSIGLVPTMGNLHHGHLSLVERSKSENDFCVVSIFINPTQFGADEDFNSYPRTMDEDLEKLSASAVDLVFVPEIGEIYTKVDNVFVSENKKTRVLCGAFRPGHFNGVLTIVLKLFNLFRPDRAYFGLKDYQQYILIKDMVASLNLKLEVVPCPILREEDGLAMSSRNAYLTKEQRARSLSMNKALVEIKKSFSSGNNSVQDLKALALKELQEQGLRVQYVEILDRNDLSLVKNASSGDLLAVAAFCDQVRLIDNLIL